MNSMQLKDKLRNISKEKNVDINTLLRIYMYDRFIERLSVVSIVKILLWILFKYFIWSRIKKYNGY